MEDWKEEELQSFLIAFKSASIATRGVFEAMLHPAALLFSPPGSDNVSFGEKRRWLRENAETLSIPCGPDGDVLRDLAIAWVEVNLHADTSDDDWFEASTGHIFRLGEYCQSLSGLDALLWHWCLGVELCIWTHGMLDRLYGGKGEDVGRILRDRTDDDTHQTLARLRCAPNMLGGLGQFVDSKKAQKQWISSGGYFFGRLLFTHALCTGDLI